MEGGSHRTPWEVEFNCAFLRGCLGRVQGAGEQGAVRWNHNIELSVDRLRFMNSIVHFDRGIGRKTKVVGVMVSVI